MSSIVSVTSGFTQLMTLLDPAMIGVVGPGMNPASKKISFKSSSRKLSK